MDWKQLLLVLAPALALAAVVRLVVKRRIAQAETVARAGAQAELATLAERLRGRDEQLAALRADLDAARARDQEQAGRAIELGARLAEATARLEEEREQGQEKLALLAQAEQKLTDSFARLSRTALAESNDSFLKLARQAFETLQTASQGDLEQRRQAIEALVTPLKDQLGRYEASIAELERTRQSAYGSLGEQLRSLTVSQEGLVRETGRLVTALRRPEVRGNWGEVQLKRSVEFAGMLDRVDFVSQETVAGEDGRLRPDLVVKLPGGKHVVVDAKVPLDAFLAAVEATSDDDRRGALERHARQVRSHFGQLSQKRYWDQFDDAPEFVVLFLPSDSYFSAALEHDPQLLEDALEVRVLIATPTTLIALLKSVYYGWRQESLAANAREISDAARELYDRLCTFAEHLSGVGKGLSGAVASYNKAVGSFEARVLPQGRRFESLGPAAGKSIDSPPATEAAPRALAASDVDPAAPKSN
jgi:DNA recombination protein RmuC